MYPASCEYFAPSSLEEACEILDRFDGDAKVLAGGQSLVPAMKLRVTAPRARTGVNASAYSTPTCSPR